MKRTYFMKGINYWPARKAMYWWKTFDLQEVTEDFRKLQKYQLNLVRIFLLWEDFQPQANRISPVSLDHLKRLADLAERLNMQLMPTFFCGHMSGVNWFPEWMLKAPALRQRFPVYANGRLQQASIRNYYTEETLLEAQLLQVRKICASLKGHPAINAYDLGNESSNCVIPPDRNMAQNWLRLICKEIRQADPTSFITLGMHAEDLEEDRHLWPQDAALFCDFLCMHGYPFYLSWVANPFDHDLVPFLGIMTRWLGRKPVLFQEFGAPTQSKFASPDKQDSDAQPSYQRWPEDTLAEYYQKTLPALQTAGMLGAMAWCFSDYQTSLWHNPPLQANPHERHFGLFRADGSAKTAASVWQQFAAASIQDPAQTAADPQVNWLKDMDPAHFYDQPRENLACLFHRYKQSLERK